MSMFLVLLAMGLLFAAVVAAPFVAVHLVAEWWFSRDAEDETPEADPSASDTFMCPACGDGPWHKDWGYYCPNCSGAD